MLRSGDKIGHYTLINKLGRGAFGTVWLGERRTAITATMVALKIPLDDDVDLEAVKQEANLWVKASGHPNVLPIIEADIYGGQLIIASEYAPDGSLESWLKRNNGKAPSVDDAVEIIAGILAGLEHLHARGIIHRDLKPANILFQGDIPRLADFGVSRALSTNQSGNAAGTPAYMAPEALNGERSIQTDIWSVGVILYQLLAGHLPFPQQDIASLVQAILYQPPASPTTFVPIFLKAIVNRALAKDLSQRYESAAEMRADIKSQRVMFELMLQPKKKTPATSGSANRKTTSIDRAKDDPRPQHYHFAHIYLREKAMVIPEPLVNDLRGESGLRRLNFYWMSNAMALRSPNEEFIQADGLDCIPVKLNADYYGVIVQLPQPERMAEAYFVAIILRDSEKNELPSGSSKPMCRYITLEFGKNKDGSKRTVLGEWKNGSHFSYGSGPIPEPQAFLEAIRRLIVN